MQEYLDLEYAAVNCARGEEIRGAEVGIAVTRS
jgi:hypothetical protein